MTLRGIGHVPDTPWRSARPCGPWDLGQCRTGHRVDPTGRRTRGRSPGTPGRTHVPSDTGPSAWDSWSNTRTFGFGPESTRTAGRPGGPSETGPSPPGQPVDTACPWTRARVPRDRWATLWDLSRARVPWKSWLIPRAFRPRPESPRTFGRNRGPSESGRSHPGQLVDPDGPRARARVTRDAWSTPQCFPPGPELPGTAGRPRVHSVPGTSHQGQLVDTAGLQTRARVARDACLTPCSLPPGPSRPGQLVDPT